MFSSMIIAFSTYSRLPMPHTDWNEKSMRYSMCFFPVIGAVIGGLQIALIYILANVLHVGSGLSSALIVALPLIVTGGIHFDGYLDTMDAKSSYKDRNEKLAILKDPHVGAFAVIYGILYIILLYGLIQELYRGYISDKVLRDIIIWAVGYVYSRSLSGLSVVTLKKAKPDGMLADTAHASDKRVGAVMAIWVIASAVGMICADVVCGAVAVIAGAMVFCYYRWMSYKKFGGITGDLAGYFLQMCELFVLAGVVLVGLVR